MTGLLGVITSVCMGKVRNQGLSPTLPMRDRVETSANLWPLTKGMWLKTCFLKSAQMASILHAGPPPCLCELHLQLNSFPRVNPTANSVFCLETGSCCMTQACLKLTNLLLSLLRIKGRHHSPNCHVLRGIFIAWKIWRLSRQPPSPPFQRHHCPFYSSAKDLSHWTMWYSDNFVSGKD